mmetsp:Transcript_18714/g.54023  ORF Transcript_18714/g.54023 Transcript_18714/m.54023 type:complete len:310 (+) Transcript_18714:902-1831(+)
MAQEGTSDRLLLDGGKGTHQIVDASRAALPVIRSVRLGGEHRGLIDHHEGRILVQQSLSVAQFVARGESTGTGIDPHVRPGLDDRRTHHPPVSLTIHTFDVLLEILLLGDELGELMFAAAPTLGEVGVLDLAGTVDGPGIVASSSSGIVLLHNVLLVQEVHPGPHGAHLDQFVRLTEGQIVHGAGDGLVEGHGAGSDGVDALHPRGRTLLLLLLLLSNSIGFHAFVVSLVRCVGKSGRGDVLRRQRFDARGGDRHHHRLGGDALQLRAVRSFFAVAVARDAKVGLRRRRERNVGRSRRRGRRRRGDPRE